MAPDDQAVGDPYPHMKIYVMYEFDDDDDWIKADFKKKWGREPRVFMAGNAKGAGPITEQEFKQRCFEETTG